MSAQARTAADAGRCIADALGANGLPYALGGALALAVAGVPRGTKDVDVNVFVGLDALDRVFDVLARLGIAIDRTAAAARAACDGMFVGNWDGSEVP